MDMGLTSSQMEIYIQVSGFMGTSKARVSTLVNKEEATVENGQKIFSMVKENFKLQMDNNILVNLSKV